MSNVYRIMTTLALAQAAIAAEWTSTTSDSKQCAAWQIATTERFECDMNWNCKAKDSFKEMLGNDAEVIANQEKNVSAGGDDWKWKCDPTFLVVLQKHALQGDVAAEDVAAAEDAASWDEESDSEDAIKDFIERYVDPEAAQQWADETAASWNEMAERHQQEAQDWAEGTAKDIEEGINGILR